MAKSAKSIERNAKLALEAKFNDFCAGPFLLEFGLISLADVREISPNSSYYAYLAEYNILLLLGGNKNGQNKDITQAQKILGKYAEVSSQKRR
ncbi:MAG TPA: hypothetical protein VJ112_04845 [Rhabdochlamydiaceae bacterium]|nr:hypothetical protein [Rhabdochlamydiaceae bacterium]